MRIITWESMDTSHSAYLNSNCTRRSEIVLHLAYEYEEEGALLELENLLGVQWPAVIN